MLEYNHSEIHLFCKNPLSSAVIFHLQTISFTLIMGTFCVPCSRGFLVKYFFIIIALLSKWAAWYIFFLTELLIQWHYIIF